MPPTRAQAAKALSRVTSFTLLPGFPVCFFVLVVRQRSSPVVEIGDAVARSGGARLGAGVPKDETRRQVDRPDLAGRVAAANPVEQYVGGDPAHLVQIPGQRRDPRRCMPRAVA